MKGDVWVHSYRQLNTTPFTSFRPDQMETLVCLAYVKGKSRSQDPSVRRASGRARLRPSRGRGALARLGRSLALPGASPYPRIQFDCELETSIFEKVRSPDARIFAARSLYPRSHPAP